jgi:hypothetical protein
MVKQNEMVVFDANFFICMSSIRAKNILENLHQAGSNNFHF